jgi:hypothetical protein
MKARGARIEDFERRAKAEPPLSPAVSAKIDQARQLRRTGIALTFSGVACEVTTIALWGATVGVANASGFDRYSPDPPAYWPLFGLAIATTVVAPILLGTGIPPVVRWCASTARGICTNVVGTSLTNRRHMIMPRRSG